MRSLLGVFLIGALAAGACTAGPTAGSMMPASPTTPSGLVSGAVVTGTWVGTVADSSGTMMGAGLSASMMGNMTWQITQTGNTLTGVMQFPGYAGSGTVSATINGKAATFTMTMPSGGMMTGTCSATSNGTFDMDDLMTQMHGTYSGSNTCAGMFDHGQISMTRR